MSPRILVILFLEKITFLNLDHKKLFVQIVKL